MGVFVASQFMAFPIMLPFMVAVPHLVLADLFILDHQRSEEIKKQILSKSALPDLWLKLYWMIHFAFLAFAEGLAVPRY